MQISYAQPLQFIVEHSYHTIPGSQYHTYYNQPKSHISIIHIALIVPYHTSYDIVPRCHMSIKIVSSYNKVYYYVNVFMRPIIICNICYYTSHTTVCRWQYYPVVMRELMSLWGIRIPEKCSLCNAEPFGATWNFPAI